MNWKNRLKNYNFWISIFSAVLLILQALKIEFDVAYVNEIFTAVLGLLVVVGIIIDPTKTVETSKTKTAKQKTENSKVEENKAETSLPIDEKNEVNNLNNENDFQVVLNNISVDLANKLKELGEINQQVTQSLKEIQNNKTEVEVINGNALPAAAEMENPYIDLMK